MLNKLRQLMLGLNAQSNDRSNIRDLRGLVIQTARAIKNGVSLKAMLADIAQIEARHAAEVASWASIRDIANASMAARPLNRGFDACELRIWLALAKAAGIPAIPAREIASFTDEEISAVCENFNIADVAATRIIAKAAQNLEPVASAPPQAIDPRMVAARLFDAMDDVPMGWMVRSNRCGSSDLKSLAMVGIAEASPPEVRFSPDLEIGPGWIRTGNRRRINATDRRIVQSIAQGPGGVTFLARPWQQASRYVTVEDPHRMGTPIAGQGTWPCEWRAFVETGQVVAVSSYYGWIETVSPETAAQALAVRERAQAIADLATTIGAWPRYADVELLRNGPALTANPDLAASLETTFGRETVSCTLDFIETDQGPMLLEGGPAMSPAGGAHPCSFAGIMQPQIGAVSKIEGVAFRTMPHVIMADPGTWTDGDRTGCILTWDEVHALAQKAT